MTDEWGLPGETSSKALKAEVPKINPKIQHIPKPVKPLSVERPKPESELTPDQLQIRNLQDQLARVQGQKDPDQQIVPPDKDGENILIHFIADGLTALGKTWYCGQMLEITVGSQAYQDTCDRTGFSWLSVRDDDFAQMDRWGKVYFHSGPWRGKGYKDGINSFEELKGSDKKSKISGPTEDELEKAETLERQRQRAAPILPTE
jgi:hypothetical protein